MSSPRPLEAKLLAPAERKLESLTSHFNGSTSRIEILEGFAAQLGGWNLADFRSTLPDDYCLSVKDAAAAAGELSEPVAQSGIDPSIALTSLARPRLTVAEQRASGAFYTDFRLAANLASRVLEHVDDRPLVLDPASGTGILLVAFVVESCGSDQRSRAQLLRDGVCAADLSVDALRGARAGLASLTSDLDAIRVMAGRLRRHDSLIEGRSVWSDVAPNGFDLLIGNPPWEKLKVSRHEHLKSAGADRHYGADYDSHHHSLELLEARERLSGYVQELEKLYPLASAGEPDLYKAFIELCLSLAAPEGALGLLVPAGLIRSQSTLSLRRRLFEASESTTLAVTENRARFFAIDTRFKFLTLSSRLRVGSAPDNHKIVLTHQDGTAIDVIETGRAETTVQRLHSMRPDLTFPEVRSEEEWELFERLTEAGVALGLVQNTWRPEIVREVDMTRDRKLFRRAKTKGAVPLVEGRMVHQFRSAAKSYVSGTGRRAVWEVNPFGASAAPQFFIQETDLPSAAGARLSCRRIGFCDVTGQTNERTVLASIIEPGVACGNKVPTVLLPAAQGSEDDLYAWIAVANSFVFDWAARRIVTTTLNYFLLESLPFPNIEPNSLPARRLATLGRQVMAAESIGATDLWQLGQARAEIDVTVAIAYGLEFDQLCLILSDFPLLDRGQPPIDGEPTSTVTADVLLARGADHWGITTNHSARAYQARTAGAVPYVPSSFVEPVQRTHSSRPTHHTAQGSV